MPDQDRQPAPGGKKVREAGPPWSQGWNPQQGDAPLHSFKPKGEPRPYPGLLGLVLKPSWAESLGLTGPFREAFEEGMFHPVPRKTSLADLLGFFTLFSFVNQVVTGVLLLMFYQPTVAGAWQSNHLAQSIPIENFIIGLHYWGANAMVILVGAHMLRVLYVAAYKRPRELQWVTGVMMLGLVVLAAFTGYLLPWDQQAYWATIVGTAIAGYVPVIGTYIEQLLRGSDYITGATLSRFFAIHVALIPILLALLIGLHLILVFAHGQTEVERALPEEYRKNHKAGDASDMPPQGFRPFWPYTLWQMIGGAVVVLALLVVLALKYPAPLIAQADPLNRAHYTPVPIWFFYWMYQLLKYVPYQMDGFAMGVVPVIGGVILLLLPWLDRNPRHEPRHRPIALSVTGLVTVGVLMFTYIGSKEQGIQTPAAPKTAIVNATFSQDVHPLLLSNCTPCHISETTAGLNMSTYAGLMKGGINGKVVNPGDPSTSLIILALEGKAPDGIPQMPFGGTPLPATDIQTIANWIKAGAKNN